MHNINTTGSNTYGSQYARTHLEDNPDQFVEGTILQFGRGKVSTGTIHTVLGCSVKVMAGISHRAIIIDTRKISHEKEEETFPLSRLVKWRGLYWYVHAVHGTFVQLNLIGANKRKAGYGLHSKGKVTFVTKYR